MSTRPRSPRRALIGLVVVALSIPATLGPAAATDVDALRDRAQEVSARVTGLSRRLQALQSRERQLQDEVEDSTARIGALELAIHRSEARLAVARATYVERAREAYMEGPNGELALLLSARSFSELVTIAQAASEVAEADSEALVRLIAAARKAERTQAELDERKQRLMTAQQRVDTLGAAISVTIDKQSATLRSLRDEIEVLQEEARREAAEARREATAEPEAVAATPAFSVGAPYGSHPSQDGSGPSNGIPSGFAGIGVSFEGIASWYGPGFEGNLTANGDVFDPSKYTAASKELPLGSWLYVEHAGRGVVVLVNDRGPYVAGRVLDLSEAAAKAIGITGLGWVRAEVIVKTR